MDYVQQMDENINLYRSNNLPLLAQFQVGKIKLSQTFDLAVSSQSFK
jgi:hypothetical protein